MHRAPFHYFTDLTANSCVLPAIADSLHDDVTGSTSLWELRATLAEKEVTTLKEQLATTSPTPLQATVPKTNGSHIEPTRDQATETRIDRFSPDIKEEKQDVDDDVEQKMEMAATGRSNSNSSRSSPVVHQPGNLEVELAAKEKEFIRH
ncbi:unnamed protein product [Spodoptera littoralis]|uniref:Uncharacterized protein n=1 Tax=Spodoptera littoralis TaxID=7109 RepID=A0A9P0N3Q6_SPOLI|nr:unnamed protein product [Spodoptera littoralis]CAH1641323.1 unnamed protein product [Spodoptera littoralis]